MGAAGWGGWRAVQTLGAATPYPALRLVGVQVSQKVKAMSGWKKRHLRGSRPLSVLLLTVPQRKQASTLPGN